MSDEGARIAVVDGCASRRLRFKFFGPSNPKWTDDIIGDHTDLNDAYFGDADFFNSRLQRFSGL